MACGVPWIFGKKDSGKEGRKFCIWFQGESELVFGFRVGGGGGLEFIQPVALLRKKSERAQRRGVGDGEEKRGWGGGREDLLGGKSDGEFESELVEESLEVGIGFGLWGEGKGEGGGRWQAGFAADKPVDSGFDGNLLRERLVGGRSELNEQDGFLLVAVADEWRDENFFWKGELEFTRGPSGGEFPSDGGRQAGVARVRPVDVPAGNGTKTEAEGDRLALFDQDWFGEEVDDGLGGFGDGAGPKGCVEQ